jgi:hypothetical protein
VNAREVGNNEIRMGFDPGKNDQIGVKIINNEQPATDATPPSEATPPGGSPFGAPPGAANPASAAPDPNELKPSAAPDPNELKPTDGGDQTMPD